MSEDGLIVTIEHCKSSKPILSRATGLQKLLQEQGTNINRVVHIFDLLLISNDYRSCCRDEPIWCAIQRKFCCMYRGT